jgi:hypothetical protein
MIRQLISIVFVAYFTFSNISKVFPEKTWLILEGKRVMVHQLVITYQNHVNLNFDDDPPSTSLASLFEENEQVEKCLRLFI